MFIHQLRDLRIRVAKCVDCYARREIQVLPVLDVPEITAFTTLEDYRRTGVRRDHVLQLLGHKRRGGGVF